MPANAKAAAERLGLTQSAVHDMVRAGRLVASGRPALIDDDSITRVASERRLEALRRIDDELELAQKVARILDPKPTIIRRANGDPDPQSLAASVQAPRGPGALHLVPADAWSCWGPTVLKSAAARPQWNTSKRGCLTCWTKLSASVHQTLGPRGDAPTRALLGQPCATCTQEFAEETADAKQAMTRLRLQLKGQAAADRRARLTRAADSAYAELQAAARRHTAAVQAARAAGIPARRARGGRR